MNTNANHWMLTASGAEYYLSGNLTLMPDNAPCIEDIAHSLAQINRFNGHTKRPYSVAEHSLLVADIAASRGVSRTVELACLLHDAHEAYVGDMSSPLKWALGMPWIGLEAPHIANVRRHFGITTVGVGARAEIKRCDLIALATERRDLTSFAPGTHMPWAILDTPGQQVAPWGDVNLDAANRHDTDWTQWRDAFLARYRLLRNLQRWLQHPGEAEPTRQHPRQHALDLRDTRSPAAPQFTQPDADGVITNLKEAQK